ncbi:DUF1826 domain-containing protein [Ruegeria arenilitoris]|uniref:DUF1826 domain-containing protein n=1 Tax=Ruegeria arenilitoris TaxID=1173585 RepID=UPI00147DD556|nr:DUF1826 domain-containing protein [Ruegeria arenilitoris]
MIYAREAVKDAAIGAGVAETPEGLTTIHHPGCAAVLWRRKPLNRFQSWIDGLPSEYLPQARLILRPKAVRQAVSEICEAAETPKGTKCDRLIEDVDALSDIFANVMVTEWLRLRLDVVTTNACRRFHIDAVTARLVCTYRGTGTQYGVSSNGADPSRVFTVPTATPILLRGTRWPEQPKSGLLHRSPPIEGSGETRLVLVLDPVVGPNSKFEQVLID